MERDIVNSTPRFALPGSWGRVDLSSDASMRRSIRKLTETVTGRRDELATTRAEIRARFLQAAELAREGGATEMYLGLELMAGIPLPAWLTVFLADFDSVDFRALGLEDLGRLLATSAGEAPEGGESHVSALSARTPIQVVRHSFRRTAHVKEGNVERDFDIIEADYWIAAANPSRVAMLTFSTALAEYEDEMLELFDAVVQTIRWPAPDAEEVALVEA